MREPTVCEMNALWTSCEEHLRRTTSSMGVTISLRDLAAYFRSLEDAAAEASRRWKEANGPGR